MDLLPILDFLNLFPVPPEHEAGQRPHWSQLNWPHTYMINNQLHVRYRVCVCLSLRYLYLERFRYAVVVSRLLSSEAFVGGVAVVSKPHPLLKLVHTILSLL